MELSEQTKDALKGGACGVIFGTPTFVLLGRSGIKYYSAYRNPRFLMVASVLCGIGGAYIGVLTGI
jgi:hypothetical protein